MAIEYYGRRRPTIEVTTPGELEEALDTLHNFGDAKSAPYLERAMEGGVRNG